MCYNIKSSDTISLLQIYLRGTIMIHEPSIDKLVEKVHCKYTLCCLVSKRARQIVSQPNNFSPEVLEKPISEAAKELYEGKLSFTRD